MCIQSMHGPLCVCMNMNILSSKHSEYLCLSTYLCLGRFAFLHKSCMYRSVFPFTYIDEFSYFLLQTTNGFSESKISLSTTKKNIF